MPRKKSSDKPMLDPNDNMFYGLQLDEHQQRFKDLIFDNEHIVVACEAKAGTGKTQIAVACANLLVQCGRYDRLTYVTFPCNEEKMGYLPGDINEKSALYFEPLREALIKCNVIPEKVFDTNIDSAKNGEAYVHPTTHAYLRGVNFEKSVVILEECQNGYLDEIRKVLTRCHDDCKVIMIGNHIQCDLLKNKDNSGFQKFMDAFEKYPWFARCELVKNYRGVLANAADEV